MKDAPDLTPGYMSHVDTLTNAKSTIIKKKNQGVLATLKP